MGIVDHNRLTGPNFSDWLRNLKLILNLVDSKVIGPLPLGATQEEFKMLDRCSEHDMRARCYMLAFMTNEL